MPRYYPLCLDLEHLPCLVVGGGKVGLRKVRTLLEHDARVTVVGPQPHPELVELAGAGRIALHDRPYATSDLDGIRLVFVATDDEAINRRVAAAARERGILTNVVDRPALCDFIVPSIVRRGSLLVAVSTQGQCPAYSKHLRRALEKQFDESCGAFVEWLGEVRRELIARVGDPAVSGRLLTRLLDEDVFAVFRERGPEAGRSHARALLDAWLQNSP